MPLGPLSKEQVERLEAADYATSRYQGVYIARLVAQPNTFKIGQSRNIPNRLEALPRTYGKIECILIIPHEQPELLERQLHSRFAAMRIYKGANWSELFCFATRRQQKTFDRFLVEMARHRPIPVTWKQERVSTRRYKGPHVILPLPVFLGLLRLLPASILETNLRHERQMAGIQAAQARGIHFGRQSGVSPREISTVSLSGPRAPAARGAPGTGRGGGLAF
jgi:T5orf172 domain